MHQPQDIQGEDISISCPQSKSLYIVMYLACAFSGAITGIAAGWMIWG